MSGEMKLGEQIRAAREARGMSQKELATELGKGGKERTIQSWEAGDTRPRGHTLARLRVILDLEGSEEETRAEWSPRVQRVVRVICDQIDTLPPDQLRAWRHAIVVKMMAGNLNSLPPDWSDDVEVIADILGAYLEGGE